MGIVVATNNSFWVFYMIEKGLELSDKKHAEKYEKTNKAHEKDLFKWTDRQTDWQKNRKSEREMFKAIFIMVEVVVYFLMISNVTFPVT